MEALLDILVSRMNYAAFVFLMMLGLYGIFAKKNYMKKVIGLNILQTAIVLFFISSGAKKNAGIPILEGHGTHSHEEVYEAIHYVNPLPHVLMLTAIVVAVATLGVALAIVIKIYREFKTIEEDQIIMHLSENKGRMK